MRFFGAVSELSSALKLEAHALRSLSITRRDQEEAVHSERQRTVENVIIPIASFVALLVVAAQLVFG